MEEDDLVYVVFVAKTLIKTIGLRVKELMDSSGMKIEVLAEKAGVGRNTVGDLSRGKAKNVTLGTLENILGALGVTIYDLLDGSPSWVNHPSFEEFKRSGLARGASESELEELRKETSWHGGEPTPAAWLHVDPVHLSLLAHSMWGRSITEERDNRILGKLLDESGDPDGVEPKTRQAFRGHVTRYMLREIKPLAEQKLKRTGR